MVGKEVGWIVGCLVGLSLGLHVCWIVGFIEGWQLGNPLG